MAEPAIHPARGVRRNDSAPAAGSRAGDSRADVDPPPGAPPQTTRAYRVRFDEATTEGTARTSTLLRWAQDVAWIHSERLGFTRDWYAKRGLAWLVRGVELNVLLPVSTGDEIEVTTGVVGYRKVWARRRTDFHDSPGIVAAWAHTDWVMTDGRGSPVRVPAEFGAFIAQPAPSFTPTRVPLPSTPERAFSRTLPVRPRELDPMGHVNNAVYLDHLEECVAALDGGERALKALPRTYRLEYLLPAEPGANLQGRAWTSPDGSHAFRLSDAKMTELFRGRLET